MTTPLNPPAPRAPVQARSRRTLSRILEATQSLMAEKGREALTVQDIVARAKTSVGSFYARFSGKEELLAYLEQGVWSRVRTEWDQGLAARVHGTTTLEARIRAIVSLLVELGRDPALRPSPIEAGGVGERAAVARHLRDSVSGALLDLRAAIRHPTPERAIELGFAAVRGALAERPEGWEDEALTEELSRLWGSYLGTNEGNAGEPTGPVDYFQVWE